MSDPNRHPFVLRLADEVVVMTPQDGWDVDLTYDEVMRLAMDLLLCADKLRNDPE